MNAKAKAKSAPDFGPVYPTRYNAWLDYQRQGNRNWRFIDHSTGKTVGPSYASEHELLADLERFADVFGCA